MTFELYDQVANWKCYDSFCGSPQIWRGKAISNAYIFADKKQTTRKPTASMSNDKFSGSVLRSWSLVTQWIPVGFSFNRVGSLISWRGATRSDWQTWTHSENKPGTPR